VDSSGDQRFVLENDLVLTGNAVIQGSLTVRARGCHARVRPAAAACGLQLLADCQLRHRAAPAAREHGLQPCG
jgi:hypothetical protein